MIGKENMKKFRFWNPVLILSLLFTAPAVLEAGKPMGLVVFKKGRVYLYRGGKRSVLKKDDLLMARDRIRTGRRAKVSIQFRTGAIFRIGPKSNVTIRSLHRKSVAMKLGSGSVAGRVKGYRVQITTPTAIAGVRGTEFIVESSQKKAKVLVNKGIVEVTNPRGVEKKTVTAGKKVVATTRGLQLSIMQAYEKQKFKIFAEFNRVKKANIEMLIEQKRRNMEMMNRNKKKLF